MKLISNILFGFGIVFLIVGIFDPAPNIHFGNIGFIAIILGIFMLLIRFIEEKNYKGLLSIIITIVVIGIIWKLPIIRTSFYKVDCVENSGECVFESSATGIKYITIKDWGFRKLENAIQRGSGNCGIAGCNHENIEWQP